MYLLGIHLAALGGNTKARLWVAGRKDWKKSLAKINTAGRKVVWFHSSSFGEFEDSRTIIDDIKTKHPEVFMLLTFFSPSGFEYFKNYKYADAVVYMPLDLKSRARYFVKLFKPSLAIFSRTDIWYNYLNILKQKKIPIYLTSFTLRKDSKFLKFPQNLFYKKCFNSFTHICCQDELTEQIVRSAISNVATSVCGNMRTDAVLRKELQAHGVDKVKQFVGEGFCVMAGSTTAAEEKILIDCFQKLNDNKIKWIIVPHELDEVEPNNFWQSELACLYTEYTEHQNQKLIMKANVMGLLAAFYQVANIAYVGGGFGKQGIHNIIEPARFGCSIIIGPNHRSYPESLALTSQGGVEVIQHLEDLHNVIATLIGDVAWREKMAEVNRNYVKVSAGATERTYKVLMQNLL